MIRGDKLVPSRKPGKLPTHLRKGMLDDTHQAAHASLLFALLKVFNQHPGTLSTSGDVQIG